MANTRLQDMRAGLKRKGPRGRAENYNAVREGLRDGEAERQRKRRDLLRESSEVARFLAVVHDQVDVERELSSREISLVSSEIVDFFTKKMQQCLEASSRFKIMEQFLQDDRISPFPPEYYPSGQDAKAQFAFLKNYQSELDAVKGVQSADMLARKVVLLDAATSATVTCTKSLSRLLKVNPSNIRMAITRRTSVRLLGTPFALAKRRRGQGSLTRLKSLLQSGGEKKPVESKDLVLHSTFVVVWSAPLNVCIAYVMLRINVQAIFCVAHLDVTIKQRAFEKLKLYFVRPCNERNVCCCRYHVEIDMLREGFNQIQADTRGIHILENCQCLCDVCLFSVEESLCKAHTKTYAGTTALWEDIVCPKFENKEWYALQCVMGTCENCGISKLLICPLESSSSSNVTWKCFENETIGVTREGKPRKRIVEVYKETSPKVFFDYFKSKLPQFVKHSFIARWQDQHCKHSMQCLGKDVILSHIDFAENYTFEIQNQIQSMYWCSTQISILVHITYRFKPDGDMLKESHFCITDDEKHDSLFVQHCLMQHWGWLQSQGIRPKHHIVWSDGCAGQFKGARPFYFVARYPGATNGCTMNWNFFGTGHGKGEWDGAGAVVKRALRQSQLHNTWRRMQNASDAMSFLNDTMGGTVDTNFEKTGIKEVKRYFWLIPKDIMRDRSYHCETVQGSQALHSIYSFSVADPTQLFVCKLSCFCAYCLDGKFVNCVNTSHVENWDLVKIKPYALQEVAAYMTDHAVPDGDDWEEAVEGEGFGDLIRLGDNFAVPALEGNTEGVEFYILQCTREKYQVQQGFKCAWGPDFEAGDIILQGTYYQKWNNGYVFLTNSQPAHIDAHLVVHGKFAMIPKPGRRKGEEVTYDLSKDNLDTISALLHQFREEEDSG